MRFRWLERRRVRRLLKGKGGIRLDVGCGANKQPGFVGMDVRNLPEVDIVHDWNDLPWPLPDESCLAIMASHVLEHVNPANFGMIKFMDECWRILKPGGQIAIAMPHGRSQGYLQDPSHCNQRNEATWSYFDPGFPLYGIYQPKPWKIETLNWATEGNMEVVLRKREEKRDA